MSCGFIDHSDPDFELLTTYLQSYTNLKEAKKDGQETNKCNINYLLINLGDVHLKYKNIFVHSFTESLKRLYKYDSSFFGFFSIALTETFYSMEMNILQSLMECHFNMASDFNCVRSIVNLKCVNDIFTTQFFQANVKQSKEVFFRLFWKIFS